MRLNSIIRIEFVWYWLDEKGKWIEYGKKDSEHCAATITSSELETAFLADHRSVVFFRAGTQLYELNFQEMVQRNVYHRTKRRVSRWPRFIFFGGGQESDKGHQFESSLPVHSFPSNWDESALPNVGYKVFGCYLSIPDGYRYSCFIKATNSRMLVEVAEQVVDSVDQRLSLVTVSSTTEEYHEIKELFENTMEGYIINRIQRIQNPSLWQIFQWQREQMKKLSRGKEVDERLLFHGTSTSHLHDICAQNFDWRICGTHGTLYGKGSYFARDANYSHNYCHSNTRTKTMIVARVLVGEYVPGNSAYLRPPSRPNQSDCFYDSCVDSLHNPSIFVIFEKHQIYPAYIIEYEQVSHCLIM